MINQSYRYHDFSYGHRVHGHPNKCAVLHGHNGRAHFYCEGALNNLGMPIDFAEINRLLCQWVESNWDHKFLVWENDPWFQKLQEIDPTGVVSVPFNPTSEQMANHLLLDVGPQQLKGTGVELVKVVLDETRKCSGIAKI